MRLIDLTGRRYGRLTVVKRANRRGDGQKPRWTCLCDCGNFTEAYGNNLERLLVTSCGCYRREFIRANQLPDGVSGFNNLFGDYKSRAKENDLEFSLSEDAFRQLTSNNCWYCECLPKQKSSVRDKNRSAYMYNGIDRVDSSQGYHAWNCVSCCSRCNYMKLDMKQEDFLTACHTIAGVQKKRAEESLQLSLPKLVSST